MTTPKLFNVEIYIGKIKKSTEARNIPYALALRKRNELISKGAFERSIWIVPSNT